MSDFLAKNLKKYRKSKRMTQAQLADAVNVSEMTIRRYETIGKGNREPNYKTLISLCEVLGVRPKDLVETIECNHVSNNLVESMKNTTTIRTTNKDFEELAISFSRLNSSGQKKAVEQVNLLTKIPEYRKDVEPDNTYQPTTLAAHFDGDKYTDDEMDEIKQFTKSVKSKRKDQE